MAFSNKSLDFLQENSFRDSKEWFQEHKNDYTQYVTEPFTEFVLNMQDGMKKIDAEIICDPRKIPRIYRDTRFSKKKAIFRTDMWYSFGRRHTPEQIVPEFYFDISPDGFSYGCGYYQAGTARMDVMRQMMLRRDESFEKARAAVEKQNVFELLGEMYKKDHFPDCSEDLKDWVNRRNLYVARNSNDFDLLYREDLADIVASDFYRIKELYNFFKKVETLI